MFDACQNALADLVSASGIKLILRLLLIYLFVAVFWALWEQSNGQTCCEWSLHSIGRKPVRAPSPILLLRVLDFRPIQKPTLSRFLRRRCWQNVNE